MNNAISIRYPTIIMEEIDALVKCGVYSSESDVLCDAFRVFLQHKPSTKIQVAAEMYRAGNVSLSRASEIAGTDIESFKEMLSDRDIEVKTAIPTVEELEEEMRYIE